MLFNKGSYQGAGARVHARKDFNSIEKHTVPSLYSPLTLAHPLPASSDNLYFRKVSIPCVEYCRG